MLRPPWARAHLQRSSFVAGALVIVANFQTEGTNLLTGALQSLAVAVTATLVGYLFALPLGLLAARNVSSIWEARAARLFLVIVRAVPELVVAIVFIVAVGLGLVAGALALTVGTAGFLAKLVADNIEEVAPSPREAVVSAGATKPQEITTSVLTPALPMLVGNGFYMLDINFRSVAVLGIVGGGGIGNIL
jgi:phosphonate transport system permease protein